MSSLHCGSLAQAAVKSADTWSEWFVRVKLTGLTNLKSKKSAEPPGFIGFSWRLIFLEGIEAN
jgi:hypothetical protein